MLSEENKSSQDSPRNNRTLTVQKKKKKNRTLSVECSPRKIYLHKILLGIWSVECSPRKIKLHRILLRMWQNNYLPKICTTRNLVTRFVSVCPPGFVCYSDSSPVAFTSLARSWTISDIGGLNSGCRWIQRLIMSANRDNAFSEHCPRIDGSTILDRDSMS